MANEADVQAQKGQAKGQARLIPPSPFFIIYVFLKYFLASFVAAALCAANASDRFCAE